MSGQVPMAHLLYFRKLQTNVVSEVQHIFLNYQEAKSAVDDFNHRYKLTKHFFIKSHPLSGVDHALNTDVFSFSREKNQIK